MVIIANFQPNTDCKFAIKLKKILLFHFISISKSITRKPTRRKQQIFSIDLIILLKGEFNFIYTSNIFAMLYMTRSKNICSAFQKKKGKRGKKARTPEESNGFCFLLFYRASNKRNFFRSNIKNYRF